VGTSSLSDTSCAVLALVDRLGSASPYRLKQAAQLSLFHFWSIPHTQIYTECGRLAELGLLEEEREEGGRRRRIYRLTPAGRRALRDWRAEPVTEPAELRDPGMLKLFSGAEPGPLAEAQLEQHAQALSEYDALLERPDLRPGERLALEAGIGHEREYIRFWRRVNRENDKAPAA